MGGLEEVSKTEKVNTFKKCVIKFQKMFKQTLLVNIVQ